MGEAARALEASADEAKQLCEEIRRIGKDDRVTFGELVQDSAVEQRFEALLGTLKAAKKKGFLTFEGELLLQGQHDNTVIELSGKDREEAAAAPQQDAAEPDVAAEADASEEVPEAESEVPKVPKDAEGRWAPEVTAPPEPAADNTSAKEAETAEAAAEVEADPTEAPVTSTSSATVKKTEDGKWKVDTGYIDHRTKDPNRLESRRSVLDGENAAAAVPNRSERDEEGKFKVDTSYINHRTGEVDRLEGRRSVLGAAPERVAPSASVRKESGAWKVDTSYIGHRTGDPGNLTRKEVRNTFVELIETEEAPPPRRSSSAPPCCRQSILPDFRAVMDATTDEPAQDNAKSKLIRSKKAPRRAHSHIKGLAKMVLKQVDFS
ncbi:abracl [Symbiodinium sp. CCMP2592]|nr:abracl [Symbiodinium sp. CCMP2592]